MLVTGASSGLGAAMALTLAKKYDSNLLLVARRQEKLDALKKEIEDSYSVGVVCIVADLGIPENVTRVIETCLTKEHFFGAILNAGQTHLGKYAEHPIDNQLSILRLNIESTVLLTEAFIKHFEKSGAPGRLSVISSLAAQVPAPYQAVYSGTKAFLTNFFHSLKHELTNDDLKLSVFSPGGIRTEMTEGDGFKGMESYMMPVDAAAEQAVIAFVKGTHNRIPGFGNRIGIAVMSLIPTRIVSKIMGGQYLKSIEAINK